MILEKLVTRKAQTADKNNYEDMLIKIFNFMEVRGILGRQDLK